MAEETKEINREFNAASYFAYMLEDKKFMGVRCRACGQISAVPRPTCASCRSRDLEWHELSGQGKLSTFTCISIVPVAMGKRGYGRDNPYCAGIVALAEGPRVSARILGVDGSNPQSIMSDMELVLDLEEMDPEDPSLIFRPA